MSSIVRLKGETVALEPVPYELHIPWPKVLTDGVTFCSNPGQDLLAMDVYFWFKRVDGFVDGRTLSLQFYTKPGQRVEYADGSKWFSDDFRAFIHQKAKEQGEPFGTIPNKVFEHLCVGINGSTHSFKMASSR